MSEPSLEPSDTLPECCWCDGSGYVEVAIVLDARHQGHAIPDETELLIPCMHCEGTGEEPPPDLVDLTLQRARLKGFERD